MLFCNFETMRKGLELLPNRVDLGTGFLLVPVCEVVGVRGNVVGFVLGIIEK